MKLSIQYCHKFRDGRSLFSLYEGEKLVLQFYADLMLGEFESLYQTMKYKAMDYTHPKEQAVAVAIQEGKGVWYGDICKKYDMKSGTWNTV